MTHTFNGIPMGMPANGWKRVKDIGDLGYNDLLRQGIKSGSSILSLVRKIDDGLDRFVKVDDAPFATSTTGALNTVYGQEVYTWTNVENPFVAAIGKQPWTRSGRRVKTANRTNLIVGMGETDAIPVVEQSTYGLMRFGLKQIMTPLSYTAKMQRQAQSGDDAIPTPQQVEADAAAEHALGLGSQAMLLNTETLAYNANADNAGTTVFETIDRIISCSAEEDDLGGGHTGWYDPWADAMTADRDSGTTFDAVVVHGDGTIAGGVTSPGNPDFAVDATLSLDSKDLLLKQCLKNGLKKENAFWLTGWDTYFRLKQLYEVKERIINPVNVNYTVNGVSIVGASVGFPQLASMDDIPIIVDQNCPADTIDKLYLIDRSNIFMQLATPTVMLDFGMPSMATISSALAPRMIHGKALWTEGELCATRLNTSGKLCALK
jgi:hypothetical protein